MDPRSHMQGQSTNDSCRVTTVGAREATQVPVFELQTLAYAFPVVLVQIQDRRCSVVTVAVCCLVEAFPNPS